MTRGSELPKIVARVCQISRFPTRTQMALSLALLGQVVAFTALTGCGNQVSKIAGLNDGGANGGDSIAVKISNASSSGLALSNSSTVFVFTLGLTCNGTAVSASDRPYAVGMTGITTVNIPVPSVCENPRKVVVKNVVSDPAADFPMATCAASTASTTGENYACVSSNNETMSVNVASSSATSFTATFIVRRHGGAATITGITRVRDASVQQDGMSVTSGQLALPPALELTGVVYERFPSAATTTVLSRPASRIKYKVKCFNNYEPAAFDISTGEQRGSEKCDGIALSAIKFTAITPRHLAIYNLYAAPAAKIFSGSETVAESQARLLTVTADSLKYRTTTGTTTTFINVGCDLDGQNTGVGAPGNTTYTNGGYKAPEPFCGGSIPARAASIGSAQLAPSAPDPELSEGEFWIRGEEMSDNPRQAAYLNGDHYVMFSREFPNSAGQSPTVASATYKFSLNDVVGKSNILFRAAVQDTTPWQYRILSENLTGYISAGFHLFPIKPTAVFNGTGGRVEIPTANAPKRFVSCFKTGNTPIIYQNALGSCPSGFEVVNFISPTHASKGNWLYVLGAPVEGYNTVGISTCGTASSTVSGSIIYRVNDAACPSTGIYATRSTNPVAYVPVNSSLSFYEGREDLLPPNVNQPYDIRN